MHTPTPLVPKFPRAILITGASGALGGALARQLTAPGVHLCLWGRDAARLAEIADVCRAGGAEVTVRSLDLADAAAALAALAIDDDKLQFDTAILAAGQGNSVAHGTALEEPAQVARLLTVNLSVSAALATALTARMAARAGGGLEARDGGGRLLLIGSAAGFHALPFAPAYAASKAGLARFAGALRLAAAPLGVTVTLVSPGFIDWPLGGRPVPRLLLLTQDEAARRILAAFAAGRGHVFIPRRFALLWLLDRLLPGPVRAALLRRLRPG